jgi:RNA polymerase sigma-70 factor (sigma-E family)
MTSSHDLGWTSAPAAADTTSAGAPVTGELARLFREHHGDLVRLATLLLRDRVAAEDVVQDVFTGIQARPGGLPRPETAMPYLRAAVINRCRSALRRRAVAWRFGGLRDRGTGLTEVSAEADVIRAEERREVLAALTALPARRREVLVLRYYLGLSEAEIATTLGISQGTVKSTAARGIAALAKALGEDA